LSRAAWHLENLEERLDGAHGVDPIDPSAIRSTAAPYPLSQAVPRAERVVTAAAAYLVLASVPPDKEVVAGPSAEKVPTRAATLKAAVLQKNGQLRN